MKKAHFLKLSNARDICNPKELLFSLFIKNSKGRKPRGGRCPVKELASITSCLGSSKSKGSSACQQLSSGRGSCQDLSASGPLGVWALRPEHADGSAAARGSATSTNRQAQQYASGTVIIFHIWYETIEKFTVAFISLWRQSWLHCCLKNAWKCIPN